MLKFSMKEYTILLLLFVIVALCINGFSSEELGKSLSSKDIQPEQDKNEFVSEIEDIKIVYITLYGKKYHYSKSCAGKNACEILEDDVIGIYEPCKKCM